MTRIEKIMHQADLCRLLCETLCEDVKKALPCEDDVYFNTHNRFGAKGYTKIDNDVVKLRRELLKLGAMTGGRYEID